MLDNMDLDDEEVWERKHYNVAAVVRETAAAVSFYQG